VFSRQPAAFNHQSAALSRLSAAVRRQSEGSPSTAVRGAQRLA